MITAILLSGGIGSRMGLATPKQYLPLGGKHIALHSFKLFELSPLISEIIVVCDPQYRLLFPRAKFASPGERRQDSLFNGLQQVDPSSDFILTHDAARPLINEEDLENVIEAAKECGAACLATSIKETIKQADHTQMVIKTLDRSTLYAIQTPQVLKKDLLIEGFKVAHEKKITVTDDVSLAELVHHPVKLIMGSRENIKVTTPEDLTIAETILRERTYIPL